MYIDIDSSFIGVIEPTAVPTATKTFRFILVGARGSLIRALSPSNRYESLVSNWETGVGRTIELQVVAVSF